ncbi:hypothetical protein GOBAR_AA21333 [Gossypium barbadense]|uniref:Uncharacterized protein n=1 Tax=Gossypium barbadense TaxID=3634 RepID=A0A2P5X7M3_GOSBA|nr:hypothetical protein GOBAR_AA21333 [Gossypium barbadense]
MMITSLASIATTTTLLQTTRGPLSLLRPPMTQVSPRHQLSPHPYGAAQEGSHIHRSLCDSLGTVLRSPQHGGASILPHSHQSDAPIGHPDYKELQSSQLLRNLKLHRKRFSTTTMSCPTTTITSSLDTVVVEPNFYHHWSILL